MLDGVRQLTTLLVERAGYPSVMAAVAEHAIFLHPETVAQTNHEALFATIRMRNRSERGQIAVVDGRRVLLDDNQSPAYAFLWSAGMSQYGDVQFNHVWNASRDPRAYTALWNLCVTPAFLARTTDGSNYPDVMSALRYRAYSLYGVPPEGFAVPLQPAGYDQLSWAISPEPANDLAAALRARLCRQPASRPARAAREIGWLFSDWVPDPSIPEPRSNAA